METPCASSITQHLRWCATWEDSLCYGSDDAEEIAEALFCYNEMLFIAFEFDFVSEEFRADCIEYREGV